MSRRFLENLVFQSGLWQECSSSRVAASINRRTA
jgi:hypothetical protein